jgi:hypothetical protein
MFAQTAHLVISLALLLGCSVAMAASEPPSDPPQVGQDYQDTINAAWDKAVTGDNPAMSCAALKGRVAGSGDTKAFKALFACNVEIPARYFHSYLDSVAAGEKSCMGFMREVMTKLSAMTISADVVMEMAETLEQAGDGEEAVASALGKTAGDALADSGMRQPKQLVKDRISSRTRQLCPDIANIVLD